MTSLPGVVPFYPVVIIIWAGFPADARESKGARPVVSRGSIGRPTQVIMTIGFIIITHGNSKISLGKAFKYNHFISITHGNSQISLGTAYTNNNFIIITHGN